MPNIAIGRWVCGIALAAASVSATACEQSGATPAPSPVPTTTGNGARTPPVIVSLTLSESDTTEVDRDVTVRAEIVDAETTVDKLVLLWSATAGQITGNGPTATWRLPGSTVRTPIDVTITLTVVEAFQAPGADGRVESREFRVVRETPPLRVHDPIVELSEMALGYLVTRYGDAKLGPAECLANFSDRCPGKADELAEITATRARYDNLFAEAQLGRITVDRALGTAEVWAYCRFTSRDIATGQVGTTSGSCRLTAVYEQRRWWLCSSRFSTDAPPAAVPRRP